ncbi:MAG: septal ring lytic transglycosylase RlpA family protein [Porticoccaceae bacterium]
MSRQKPANFSIQLLASSIIVCLILTGCTAVPGIVPEPKDGPGAPINTESIKDATPRVEPITKIGNKSPYTVFGKTYFVLPSSKDYREEGVASWYGKKFHGRKTSNGEVYDMYAMTAAHKTLPIPSYVRVTHAGNQRSIIVRINDRGPFHGPRIIDLSYVAALKLGFADNGTAEVLVEAIDPSGSLDRPEPEAVPPAVAKTQVVPESNPDTGPTIPPLNQGRYLQVGAFDQLEQAQALQKKIRGHTSHPILVQQRDLLYKVWIGPISDQLELRLIKQVLKQSVNISGFMVDH